MVKENECRHEQSLKYAINVLTKDYWEYVQCIFYTAAMQERIINTIRMLICSCVYLRIPRHGWLRT